MNKNSFPFIPRNEFNMLCSHCGGPVGFHKEMYFGNKAIDSYICQKPECRRLTYIKKDIPFKEEFPSIKSATVHVVEKGETMKAIKYNFSEDNIENTIRCHNTKCTQTGISLRDFIRDMVSDNLAHLIKNNQFCTGVELSPKGKYRSTCMNSFDIEINLTFK